MPEIRRVANASPPPTGRTFLRTLLPALHARGQFRDVRTFCLFIGVNRSGSSLVGSLLNAHRHALIAHELNVMHFVKRRFLRSQLFWLLRAQDQAFAAAGREWYGYDYRVEGQWQGCSEEVRVIGDKHAGAVTQLVGRRPELLARLAATVRVPVKMIHVIRHPLDNIATIHRLQELSLEAATTYYFEHAATNARLARKYGDHVLTIALEDVIANPRQQLSRICGHLDLDGPSDYLDACAAAVFAEPRKSRAGLVWPQGLSGEIARRCSQVPFLQRYAHQIHCQSRAAA